MKKNKIKDEDDGIKLPEIVNKVGRVSLLNKSDISDLQEETKNRADTGRSVDLLFQ